MSMISADIAALLRLRNSFSMAARQRSRFSFVKANLEDTTHLAFYDIEPFEFWNSIISALHDVLIVMRYSRHEKHICGI